MNPALRTSAAHVFVADLHSAALAPDEAHHLFRVLRLRDGETVTLCDGAGSWRTATVRAGALDADGEIVREAAPRPCVVAVAIPKGDRLDWMVQKLTEIGVTELLLVDFARSVVRWDRDKAERQLARLGRIAREAAAQSRRVWLPQLSGPMPFASAIALPGAALLDPDGERAALTSPVVIGPEGGFTAEERAAAASVVSMGDEVLRVETAAVVAAARLLG